MRPGRNVSRIIIRGLGCNKAAIRLCGTEAPRRFQDPWWRQFDKPTDGFRDSTGFMNRLPLRLESDEVMVYGTVDAEKMWKEFDDEPFVPVLVGGKAIISIWFNDFKDTDCGRAYLETWYNTFVTSRDQPVSLPYDGPLSVLGAPGVPGSFSFLQRVICGDAPGNPGAAAKAIAGGREIFGFPKHPVPGVISIGQDKDGSRTFAAAHSGKQAVSLKLALPKPGSEGVLVFPVELVTARDANIGAPRHGGTHKGHNGAFQSRYQTSVKATQIIAPWNSATDSLAFGTDDHYASPIKRWNFEPLLKVHSPDFKIAAMKPSGWISGEEAAADAHESPPRKASKAVLEAHNLRMDRGAVYNPEWKPTGVEASLDSNKLPWIELPMMPGFAMKPLRASKETGVFTVLMKAKKGAKQPLLVNLGASDTFILSGKLTFPNGNMKAALTPGFWAYAPAGTVMEGAFAEEDTEYLCTFHGPIAFLKSDGKSVASLLTSACVGTAATNHGLRLPAATLSDLIGTKSPTDGSGTAMAFCADKAAEAAMAWALAAVQKKSAPQNPHCVDTASLPWIVNPDSPDIGLKIIRISTETGHVTTMVRQNGQAPPHCHLGPADFYILKGRLGYREGPAGGCGPGTYVFEPAGARHEATQRVTDEDLIYAANIYGPIQFDSGAGTPVAAVLSWMGYLEAAKAFNSPLLASTFENDSGTLLASPGV